MAVQLFEIPLLPGPQLFPIDLRGVTYRLKLFYRRDPGPGWMLDIYSSEGQPILCGTPLIPGIDLLAPYPYLEIGVVLFADTEVPPGDPISYASLGTTTRLYYAFNDGS